MDARQQTKALAFIYAFEGRGRQGCPLITANKEIGPTPMTDLVGVGLVRARSRWGRTFYFLTPGGRKALGT